MTIGGNPHDSTHDARSVLAPMIASLKRVRSAARTQLVTQRGLWLIAAAVVAALALGAADYMLRLPMAIRVLHLAAGVCVLAVWFKRWVAPAIGFKPSLTDVALRLERLEPAKGAGLTGVLASGLELADRPADTGTQRELQGFVAASAAERYSTFIRTARFFDRRLLVRSVGALVLAAAPIAALMALAPSHLRIGAARTLTPWADVSWPKRTGVVDVGAPVAHPRGTALALRALLTRSDRAAAKTDITLSYRLVADGRSGPEQRVRMTPQNKAAETAASDGSTVSGDLFERLLDPDAIAVSDAKADTKVSLEYWFKTSDDETTPRRVLIVQPPAIVTANASVTPPAYATPYLASKAESKSGEWLVGDRNIGPGAPQRGIVGPVLAGSKVELSFTFNKALPKLSELPGAESAQAGKWAAEFFPGVDSESDVTVRAVENQGFALSFTAQHSVRLPILLKDEYGIAATDDFAVRIEVLEDRPPTANVIEPSQDESVLPTAAVRVAGEGRDDVALREVAIESTTARPPKDSAGAPPTAEGNPQRLVSANAQSAAVAVAGGAEVPNSTTLVRAATTLDLSPLKLNPGDEVWLTTLASDVFELKGEARAPVVSARRRLRIISEGELVEQVRAELSALREAAKRAEQEQSKVSTRSQEAAANDRAAAEMAPRQDAVTDRLRPMQEAVQRLSKRVDRNRMNDKALEGVLKDAGELVEAAGKESSKASDALDRLTKPAENRANNPEVRKAAEELNSAQKQVEEDLSQLANMLDRGQDDWAVRRAIEKMLVEQKQLRAQTKAAGEASQGKKSTELTEKEKEERARLAKEQQDLARKTNAMVAAVGQRSQQMQQSDPAQAQAMKNAEQKAQSENLAKNQEKAAEQIKQNKTGDAEQSQEQAESTLQSMLEELDKSQQRRDEALRRVLADVMESIRKLVARQEAELAQLGQAAAGQRELKGLDAAMITLQQNTLAVVTTVKSQMRGADSLASLLTGAGEAQSAAVVALRGTPPDQPEADANERISLKRLRDALAEAQKLEEDAQEREEDRKRGELKKAYKGLLELQVVLTADTSPLVGKELNRRQRADARALGSRQEEIRGKMAELREKTSEFAEVKLFDYAHTRFDAAGNAATKPLNEGSAPASVGRDQTSMVRILQGLVQALDDAEKKKDDFREDESEGEGQGQGQGQQQAPLIPPIAELKLLRAMQAEAADRTHAAADANNDAAELEAVTTLQTDLTKYAKELLEKLTQERQEKPPATERN
ncbi:MAG: hypothetical protein JSR77_03120 [Planctomycetes bacterium]|nr:hypothetical protein [Planctomycetota bacterium]